MQRSCSFLLAIIVALMMLAGPVPAQVASGIGHVRIELRDVAGKPVRNTPIRIIAIPESTRDTIYWLKRVPNMSCRSGPHGVVQCSLDANWYKMMIGATGVGYVVLDNVPVQANTTLTVACPRLVPYARISGKIDAPTKLLKRLILEHLSFGHVIESLKPGPSGTFSFDDISDRFVHIVVRARGVRVVGAGNFQVIPGQHLSDVVLPVVTLPPHAAPQGHVIYTHMWGHIRLTGIVLDSHLRPAEHVTVFVRSTYLGGLRMAVQTKQVQTDEHGHFVLSSISGNAMGPIWCFAVQPGHPVGFAELVSRKWPAEGSKPFPQHQAAEIRHVRIVLPSGPGGNLKVHVFKGDQPAPGIQVTLTNNALESVIGHGVWSRTLPNLQKIIEPQAASDKRGTVLFKHLVPGVYTVIAGAQTVIGPSLLWYQGSIGIAENVVVRPYLRGHATIQLYHTPITARMRVYASSGLPIVYQARHNGGGICLAGDRAFGGFDLTVLPPGGAVGGYWSGPDFAPDGWLSVELHGLGFHRVALDLSLQPVPYAPIPKQHYESAEAWIPVSPLLGTLSVPYVRAVTHSNIGSVTVHILSADGKPLQAAVRIGYSLFTCHGALQNQPPKGAIQGFKTSHWFSIL